MNKNKLDSMLKTIDTFKHEPIYIGNCSLVDIATMLRTIPALQAEIEELKQIIDANNLNQNIRQFVKPTNKPVAWIDKSKLDDWLHGDCYPDQCFIHYQANDAIPLYTHPVKELNDGGEPVKNATYWKRQYNLMATQNDNLKSGLYHANEQIKYLESHPVKEQDESFDRTASHMAGEYVAYKAELTDEEMKDLIQEYWGDVHIVDPDGYLHEIAFIRAILRKASEK